MSSDRDKTVDIAINQIDGAQNGFGILICFSTDDLLCSILVDGGFTTGATKAII